MAKTATVTVRIPEVLKRRIAARAAREHRSVSAQVEHELTQLFAAEPASPRAPAKILGMFESRRVPDDNDFDVVRAQLWSTLGER